MFTEKIHFIYPWRGYQQRVLNEIAAHLDNDKLHIIAPPGSGKTVLGLEVVRRLNKPTLILSPTLTIRNQWIEIFQTLFNAEEFENYSSDLNTLSFFNSSTYQSLHSCCLDTTQPTDKPNDTDVRADTDADVIQSLIEHTIQVVVLDEAHHLKTAWWKTLTTLIEKLDNPTVISLTATPPYDSTISEWNRYIALCGPIDAEIAVPELVKEKDLCAHQDLVYISMPDKKELSSINTFYNNGKILKKEVISNNKYINLLVHHPAVLNPSEHADFIYDNVEYFSSIIIFLKYVNKEHYAGVLDYLGLSKKKIPILDNDWLEYLLTYSLIKDDFLKDKADAIALFDQFKKAGLVERRKIIISKKESLNKMLISSISKFASISRIVDAEYSSSKDNLRLVILSDYVRKEYLNKPSEINKFGVVSIFRYLVNTNHQSTFDYSNKIAVLSGSIAIIPDNLKDDYLRLAKQYSKGRPEIEFKRIEGLNFSEILLSGNNKSLYVRIVTTLFSQGKINILIGTKSLLGEGWDCQEINALILATFVGSYMLSNQMRGRAIRALKNDKFKTANIWHLMCADPENPANNSDYELLRRRFKCFIGPHITDNTLISGIERLEIPESRIKSTEVERINRHMILLSAGRKELIDKWNVSIGENTDYSLVKEIKTDKSSIRRNFIFWKTLKYIFYNFILSEFYFHLHIIESFVKHFRRSISTERLLNIIGILLLLGIAALLPKTIKLLGLAIKHGPVSSSFKQLGNVILNTMKDLDIFENPDDVTVETSVSKDGLLLCSLRNSNSYKESLFLKSLEEVLGQITNPKYLITRKGRYILNTIDFHNVPSIFATNKERAALFHAHWNKLMGKSEMYSTRNPLGRRKLVEARTNSLSSYFIEKTEIIDSWKR
ncbi:MAG: DEAD/DEAH box helicase family protein [Desulfopila sp.]